MTATQTAPVSGLKRPATLDHLRKKRPVEKSIEVILSDEEMDAYDRARLNLERLLLSTDPDEAELEAARARVEEAKAALDEVTVVMTFRSVGRKAYDDLVMAHPPTDEQKEMDYSYNPETFTPAIIAASCVEPDLTLEEATAIFDEWNGSEISQLFLTALEVNTARRTADLGKGSGPTPE